MVMTHTLESRSITHTVAVSMAKTPSPTFFGEDTTTRSTSTMIHYQNGTTIEKYMSPFTTQFVSSRNNQKIFFFFPHLLGNQQRPQNLMEDVLVDFVPITVVEPPVKTGCMEVHVIVRF